MYCHCNLYAFARNLCVVFQVLHNYPKNKPLAPGEGFPPFGASGMKPPRHSTNQIKIVSPGKFMGNLWFGQVPKCVI